MITREAIAHATQALNKERNVTEIATGKPPVTLIEAQEIVATKTAPKVTVESIEAKIATVEYLHIHDNGTLCIITMKNGWNSTGFSKPADARNFDSSVGMRYAYDNAFKPLWQLEGYLLREALHQADIDPNRIDF
jgi:hypothetical protein